MLSFKIAEGGVKIFASHVRLPICAPTEEITWCTTCVAVGSEECLDCNDSRIRLVTLNGNIMERHGEGGEAGTRECLE